LHKGGAETRTLRFSCSIMVIGSPFADVAGAKWQTPTLSGGEHMRLKED